MKKLRTTKKWILDYNVIEQNTEDLEILKEFELSGETNPDEVEELHNTTLLLLEALEFRNMLSYEGDDLSSIVQITAGAGGTESCDWAQMLMRMYIMWAEKQGYKIRELNHQAGDVTGIKTVTIEINGEYALDG